MQCSKKLGTISIGCSEKRTWKRRNPLENNLKRNIGLAVAAILVTVAAVAVLLSMKSEPRQFEEAGGDRTAVTETAEANSGESTVPSWFGHEEFSDLEDVPDDVSGVPENSTEAPTHAPTAPPTHAPTEAPTAPPTHAPTEAPTVHETHTEQIPEE